MLSLVTIAAFFVLSVSGSSISEIRKLCHLADGCSDCLNMHPSCVWCLDQNMKSPYHCDVESELLKKCKASSIYKLPNKLELKMDDPLGKPDRRDPNTKLQVRPQGVLLHMRPSTVFQVKFSYLHLARETKHLILHSSNIKDTGISLDFSIKCHGREVQGAQCPNVSVGETIEFFVKVRLIECRGVETALSVGAAGYHGVVAFWIRQLCGCACEEPEVLRPGLSSSKCNRHGDMNCGMCKCHPGYGGNSCQCRLTPPTTQEHLLNFCRKEPNGEVCSGNGICECGECKCEKDHIQGRFCDCDSLSCPMADGKICAGRGRCNCGKCECEKGFGGEDCSCNLDKQACMEGNLECNGHGVCECGMCKCYSGYSGHSCGIVNEEKPDIVGGVNEGEPKDTDTPKVVPHEKTSPKISKTDEDSNLPDDGYGQPIPEEQTKSPEKVIEVFDRQDIVPTPEGEKEVEQLREENGTTEPSTHQENAPGRATHNAISPVISAFIMLNSIFILFYFVRID